MMEITQQLSMRTRVPSDDPNSEWLAVADTLGHLDVSAEGAQDTVITALEPVLNHADASVSAAGARAMGR